MRAWPVARSIFDAPLGEANERPTSWITLAGRATVCFVRRAHSPLILNRFASNEGQTLVTDQSRRSKFGKGRVRAAYKSRVLQA